MASVLSTKSLPSVMLSYDPIIYDKLVRYCAYQERAESEVRNKMRLLGVIESLYAVYLDQLKEENVLDEMRFATSYAEGKMRLKGWGVRKIEMHLKHKRIPSEIIRAVLDGDRDDQYFERLAKLAESKLERVKGKNDYDRKSKVYLYLLQKGYESDLIRKVLFTE